MTRNNTQKILTASILVATTLMMTVNSKPLSAEEAPKSKTLVLWVDQKTGQIFIQPGKGRTALKLIGATIDAGELTRQVEQNVEQNVEQKIEKSLEAKTQAAIRQTQREIQANNEALVKKAKETDDWLSSWKNKFRLSTVLFADYAMYTKTGFGPQFLTQVNPPGPGNDNFNSFDITRTYINLYFMPNDDWTFRLTPNIYRTIGASSANDKFGNAGALGSNLSGNLGFRLKYAYLQYNKIFNGIEATKGDTITLGQQPNPLIDWQEALYGFRYVNLVPWNYTSLSSTQTGISFQGPINFNGRQYVDYDLGVYTNASFRALEQTDTKQGMVRVTVYPFGAENRFNGFGLTVFYDRGHGNVTPDTVDLDPVFKGPASDIERGAAIVHYTTNDWGLAGEYDWGRNAFTPGNLFSGSGPADAFNLGPTQFANFAAMIKAILNTGNSVQEGYDFFGHYRIPNTPLTLFGMYQRFMPNTKIGTNPLDFERFVGGVSYEYSKFLRLALDSQNLIYSHDQFTFPVLPGLTTSPVPNAVPGDIHALFANLEFKY